MKFIQSVIALAATAGLATAVPVEKRQAINDAVILNYALTLEHLEDKFYREGLANYTAAQFSAAGFNGSFYTNLQTISSDETTHVAFLTAGLKAAGATPVAECTYSFPATTPQQFVALSSVLEGVGVSAYLGAAADIMSSVYLTDAGSILTVESRHSAYIRASLAENPFPQAFDTPLDFDEVYSLASQFIVSCPSSNPALPVKAFPPLMLAPTTAMPVVNGSTVTLMAPKGISSPAATVYAAFMSLTGPVFVKTTPVSGGYSVVIPAAVDGQSYVVLSTNATSVSDDTIVAGPAIVEISTPPMSI